MNKAILSGNAGQDPEVRILQNGSIMASLSLATSERYKDKDGEKKVTTTWHNLVIWGKLAEVVEKYVKKGDRLLIIGKIQNRSYEKDGQTRYITEIVVSELEFTGGNKSNIMGNEVDEELGLPF